MCSGKPPELFDQTKDGVVSYKTILQVDNGDLSLRPGMTATAEIISNERKGALLIPNAALRFTPPAAKAEEKPQGGGIIGSLLPRPPGPRKKARVEANGGTHRVWVLRDGLPVAIEVETGASNGRVTEITGGELKAGMDVIVDYQASTR